MWNKKSQMRPFAGWRAATAYGIDARDGWIAIVRMSGKAPPVTLYEGAEWPDTLLRDIGEEVRRGTGVSAAALPACDGLVRWLSVPFRSCSRARKVLPSLLDVRLPFPLEECVSAMAAMEPGEGEVRALAVAARTSALRKRLDWLGQRGIDPVLVDHEGLALWSQALYEQPSSPGQARIEVFLGRDHTLSVLGREGRFCGVHHTGTGQRTASGREEETQALAARLLRAARTLVAASEPLQWYWSGCGADDERLLEMLEEELRSGLCAVFHRHRNPAALQARALSRRARGEGGLPCNLRFGPWAHPWQKKAEIRRRRTTALCGLAAGGLLLAANTFWAATLRHREGHIAKTLARRGEAITGFPTQRGQEVLLARRALDERASDYEPFLAAFRPSAAHILADLLYEASRLNIRIESLSLAADQAAIRGRSPDWKDSEKLAALLRKHGLAVNPPVREEADEDPHVHFTLRSGSPP